MTKRRLPKELEVSSPKPLAGSEAAGHYARIAQGRDPLTPEQRSENMRRIKSRNTKPELLVRRALHARGLRFRLHDRSLPGKPDIVLPKWRAVILVHGCFWHGHGCHMGVLPRTNAEFWTEKISANRRRDTVQAAQLHALGWRVAVVWQCALAGRNRKGIDDVANILIDWLYGRSEALSIEGNGQDL
ncbi:MAG: very short patch repair endonuclease [Shinella zoogloeoides]|uniref:very short patch repair endonuclease n=1 Tax=Shinella zoogloeoides TaxID=352475 RepID=UPI003C78289A